MNRKFTRNYIWCIVSAFLVFVSSCSMYEEFNPDSKEEINFSTIATRLSFGTSSGDSSQNSVTLNADGSYTLLARNDTNNAGKIAGSEDGLTFLFKQIAKDRNFKLSADIRIIDFGGIDAVTALTTSNGQEGFGIMARDWVPQYPGLTLGDNTNAMAEYNSGETGGSGNMVMVGGIKRGVRAACRKGVIEPTGACITDESVTPDSSQSVITWLPKEFPDYSSYPTLEDRPDFPPKDTVYRLSLEKNNSGFTCRITPPVSKGTEQEIFFADPDILTSIDKDYYYVGFFAARAATINVSNITYYESDSNKDALKIIPTAEVFTPTFTISSPITNSDESYKIYAASNVRGTVSVLQDGAAVTGASFFPGVWVTESDNAAVTPYNLFDIPVFPLKDGENIFNVVFYPDEEGSITTNAAITKTFIVTKKSYFTASTDLFVSPEGSKYNTGTRGNPLDLETAINFVLPGQTIIMLNGVYSPLSVRIPRFNNGRYGAPKTLKAENRDGVIIDFKTNYFAKGLVHEGNYWVIDGIQVCNTPDKVKGYTLMGNNNIIQWVKTYGNGDTGLQISGRSTEPKTMWPMNNTIQYCDSYNNLDAAQNDADGFAAKLTVGEGNKFLWCASHHNCDDGWDLFTKKETGTIGVVTIENCVAYLNGTMLNGYQTLSGRNGFKLGGEGLNVPHVTKNCLSFFNGAHGFTSNSNPGINIINCTSFDNGGAYNPKAGADSRNFTIYASEKQETTLSTGTKFNSDIRGTMITGTLTQLLSLYSNPVVGGVNRKEDKIWLQLPANGYVWFGTGTETITGGGGGEATKNKNGSTLSVSNVLSTTAPLDAQGFISRAADGSFIVGNFLKLSNDSILAGSHFTN